MPHPIATPPRRRGRPRSGVDPIVGTRFPAETISRIDAWARARAMDRSKGLRALVEIGLAVFEEDRPLTQAEMRVINRTVPGAYGGWDAE
jgi:hypothetical protein